MQAAFLMKKKIHPVLNMKFVLYLPLITVAVAE